MEAVVARHRVRLPVRRHPRRWRGDPDVPVLHHREEAGAERRRVRPRRHRGCRRPRGRQQRLRRGHVRADAGPRTPGHRDRVGDAGRDAGVRHPARTAADDRPGRPGVDAAGQPADRQRTAAGAEPPTGAAVGQAAADPASAALRRDPVLRLPGRVHDQPRPVRHRAARGLRPARRDDATLRAAGAAADPGRDPRPDHGDQAPGGADHLRWRPVRAVRRAARGRGVRPDRPADRGAAGAAPAAPGRTAFRDRHGEGDGGSEHPIRMLARHGPR